MIFQMVSYIVLRITLLFTFPAILDGNIIYPTALHPDLSDMFSDVCQYEIGGSSWVRSYWEGAKIENTYFTVDIGVVTMSLGFT